MTVGDNRGLPRMIADGGELCGVVGDGGAWWGAAAMARVISHDALTIHSKV